MKIATVRQLRHDFGTVFSIIEGGEQVGISKRGKIIALLSPPLPPSPIPHGKRPDFAARLRIRDGDRVIPARAMDDILEFNKGLH